MAKEDKSSNDSANDRTTKAPIGTMNWQMSDDMKQWIKNHRTFVASMSSSVVSTYVAFPLDFCKSRMQTYNIGFRNTVLDAYRVEGVSAFWRGVTAPLVSVTAVRTLSFTLYQANKYRYAALFKKITGESPLDIANATGRYPNLSTMACFGLAGATSGSIITVIACPFELTKLHAQLAGKMMREGSTGKNHPPMSDLKTGTIRTAKQLIRDRGLKGLYCGYRLHLLRDTIGTSIYFTTYESAKQILGNARGGSPTSPFAVMAGGGLCGIVSWACTYPIDVAKTVYQQALLSTPPKDGHVEMPKIQFFQFSSYRGLGVSMARSAIINMIFFSMFEAIKKRINAMEA